jgi:hypothetical protein
VPSAPLVRDRHHRHGRLGPAGGGVCRPVIHRFSRLTQRGRVIGLSVSGRLLGLHALRWGAGLPDPDSSGQLPKGGAQQFGVSTSRYRAARQACQHLLPPAGSLHQEEYQCMQNSDCPPALVQQMLNADRKLAHCMRSHGVPNFPDPTTDSSGPVFNITNAGISDAASHTSQFEARLDECSRLVGGNAPESFE